MEDTFGRGITYLRLSVTELCNLRCRYCMPEEGLCKKRHEDMLTEDEMIQAVRAAASLGVYKLRITGGEPLVKKNLLSICQRAGEVEGIRELCLTTNGTLLPPLARPLRRAGLSRLNISLDTLNEEKYRYITRIGTLSQAMAGIEAALEEFDKVKVNAVLIGGFNDDEIEDLAGLTLRYPVDMRFIELMPMYDNEEFGPKAYVPGSRVLERLPQLAPVEVDGGVAALYRLPGGLGNVGLISAVSNHFCAACNRLRLTADGKLKPCLHSAQEIPIKGLDYREMRAAMERAILSKPQAHVPLSAEEISEAGRSMNQIGG
ncbi:MAG: GTP 3',8-cyclase MoaA [Oscillospiraceae bacterium]|nr:GTP 3',8-cyclase MoaA [Oscillospiraceae bacterium]